MLYKAKYNNPTYKDTQSKFYIANDIKSIASSLCTDGSNMEFIKTVSKDYIIKNTSTIVKVYYVEYSGYTSAYIIAKSPQEAIEGESDIRDIFYVGDCISLADLKQSTIKELIEKANNIRPTVEAFYRIIWSYIFNMIKENGKILFEEPIVMEDTLINYDDHDPSNYDHQDLWVESVKLDEYNHIILEGYTVKNDEKIFTEYDSHGLTTDALVYLYDKIVEK